jgi:hypothetical protein
MRAKEEIAQLLLDRETRRRMGDRGERKTVSWGDNGYSKSRLGDMTERRFAGEDLRAQNLDQAKRVDM